MYRRIPWLAIISFLACTQAAWSAQRGSLSDSAYLDKVYGAWLGKCIGGALGMPIEGWNYKDIDRRFPTIAGYVGYFADAQVGWSGMLKTVRVPQDGEWHHFTASFQVPKFDSASTHAAPIIGMSLEESTVPARWEIRGLRFLRPASIPAMRSDSWEPVLGSGWAGDGDAVFTFNGERSWVKMRSQETDKLGLKPGQTILVSFDAKWHFGDNRIGFALDYLTNEPRKGFGPDDDTSYQVIGLHALETYGPDLSCKQVGKEWVDHCPSWLPEYLAEGLALKRMKDGIAPPESGEHRIGQAIGGQMKGEIWGLVCPGRPDLAAEYARRDGVVAHCRNGVYGEQFVAVMMSAAFHEKDVRKLIDLGLSHVPGDSEYAKVVREVIALHDRYPDWRDTRRELIAEYPNACDPVYADAGVVTLALLYGDGDFDKTICIAARCGSDTDCDTATVGALMGCITGGKRIPAKWKSPIDDQFRCFAIGMENWRIPDLVKRICASGRKVLAYHGESVKFRQLM